MSARRPERAIAAMFAEQPIQLARTPVRQLKVLFDTSCNPEGGWPLVRPGRMIARRSDLRRVVPVNQEAGTHAQDALNLSGGHSYDRKLFSTGLQAGA